MALVNDIILNDSICKKRCKFRRIRMDMRMKKLWALCCRRRKRKTKVCIGCLYRDTLEQFEREFSVPDVSMP